MKQMVDETEQAPEDGWSSLLGRKVAIVNLTPAPKNRNGQPIGLKILGLVVAYLLVLAFATLVAIFALRLSGRWWVAVVVFLGVVGTSLFFNLGITRVVRGLAEQPEVDREFDLIDPIGALLPPQQSSRKVTLDPASYAGLFELEQRPVAIIEGTCFFPLGLEGRLRPLAPRGRLPEPEMLSTGYSAVLAIIGGALLFHAFITGVQIFRGASARSMLSIQYVIFACTALLGIALLLRHPFIRRQLNLPRVFGRDALIGAGWIQDPRGEVWTVEDSVMMVVFAGRSAEIRLIKRTKVWSFHVEWGSLASQPARAGEHQGADSGSATDVPQNSTRPAGLRTAERHETEMPTAREPLRLLLSSWSYPDPRPDLAPRQ